MIMFPCGMFGTKFNVKQNYTVELSLIDRKNSNKNSNALLSYVHLVRSTIQYSKYKGYFLSINLSILNNMTKMNLLNKCCPS